MGLLWLWITTIAISKSMDAITVCRIAKDLAADGYKLKPNKFKEINSDLIGIDSESKIKKYRSLIPFFNVYSSIYTGLFYVTNKGEILDQLYLLDCIERMDKDEEEEYKNNPSAFTALRIANRDKKMFEQYEPLKDKTKSKAVCVEYEKENKLRFLLLYHNLDKKGKIKVDEIRIHVEKELLKNQEEYEELLKGELKRIHKLSNKEDIYLPNFIKSILKSKHKDYMKIGETIVDKEVEIEEENIKDSGEKLDASRLDEIRKQKEALIRERNDLLTPEEPEKKLERKK